MALVAIVVLTAAAQTAYTVVTPDTRRSIPSRTINGTDMLALDTLAPVFGIGLREDTLAGGMTITTGRQTIVVINGQATASIGGRVVSLGAPVVHEGRSWFVPVDFVSRALGPASGQTIQLRPMSRTIIVGDVRWPQVSVRLERQGAGVRIAGTATPPTPFRMTREAQRVTVRFDAMAIDFSLTGASAPDLVASVRSEGTSVIVDLGPAASIVRPADDAANGAFTVDVAPAPRPGTETPEFTPTTGGLRAIAIDAGHGGEEPGASGGGLVEKTLALSLAHQLKAAIDARLGVRVLLTRDGDDTLPLDRRTAIVNNGQADVLISLHADAAPRGTVRGARVLTLDPANYERQLPAADTSVNVPVAGGGARLIDIVPWELAQLPHRARSNALAESIVARLTERQVPLAATPIDHVPLRLLAGANMPAVIVEVGYLTNADDASALAGPALPAAIVDALVAALTDLRNSMLRGPR